MRPIEIWDACVVEMLTGSQEAVPRCRASDNGNSSDRRVRQIEDDLQAAGLTGMVTPTSVRGFPVQAATAHRPKATIARSGVTYA